MKELYRKIIIPQAVLAEVTAKEDSVCRQAANRQEKDNLYPEIQTGSGSLINTIFPGDYKVPGPFCGKTQDRETPFYFFILCFWVKIFDSEEKTGYSIFREDQHTVYGILLKILIRGGAQLMKKKLPVGVDLFDKLIERGYYYLDKTLFVKTLVETCGDVNLFTRPRRFGKTLNMSMLKAFFEIGSDPSLFNGLAISREQEICESYQGKYPVIFLSLKGVEGNNFEEALGWMRIQISRECKRLEERKGRKGARQNEDVKEETSDRD